MFFKKKELSQSWEESFGFFYFQACQVSLMNYFQSQYTQILEKLEMIRDLPMVQERLEDYANQLFQTTQNMSRIHQQSAQFFDQGQSSLVTWNEFAQVFQDASVLWATDVQLFLEHSSAGVDISRADLSAIVLGFSKFILPFDFTSAQIEVKQGVSICLEGLSLDPILEAKKQNLEPKFLLAWDELIGSNLLNLNVLISEQKTVFNFTTKV